MSKLPDDLVEEILCRVPATSLKRLRYTCKRWNRVFSDRKFTRKHSHKAPKESLFLIYKNLGFYSMTINLHRSPTVEVTDELNLIDPDSSLDQFRISQFCHSSDGLFLCACVNKYCENIRLVVWNPCTGKTKWIPPRDPCKYNYKYALGSYQDKKSGNNSYKILSYRVYSYDDRNAEFEIYELNSNSRRVLDITMDCNLLGFRSVSLKGKTYWIARDEKETQLGIFLISFDYTRDRFERLCLPYQHPKFCKMSLSVVREEKLSLLLQREITSKIEIWVADKICDETKEVSWINILAVDLKSELEIGNEVNFLVDEEKKVLVFTKYRSPNFLVYIVGEDNQVKEEVFGVEVRPFLLNYVPSLTQIQQGND